MPSTEERADTAELSNPVWTRVKQVAPVVLGVGLFALGISALYRLLGPLNMQDVFAQARATPTMMLVASIAATAAGYAALIGYDWSALRYLGRKVPFPIVMMGGFMGYSFGNTIGIGAVSGGAVRYRIYSAFGLNAFEVAAVSTFVSVAFGIGITIVGLLALAMYPDALGNFLPWSHGKTQGLSLAGAAAILGMLYYLSFSGRSLRIRAVELRAPSPGLLSGQIVFTALDTCFAALALWVLLPDGAIGFVPLLAVFAAAAMVGVASHVPGGVGVFETVVIAALPDTVPLASAATALLLFRIIYFLLPFALSMVLVALIEARLASGMVARLFGKLPDQMLPFARVISAITPTVAGTSVMGIGVYLMVMAVMPSARPEQLDPNDILATILLEGGTLLTAAVGAVLLLVAQGLLRRISAAYWLTMVSLLAGSIGSLLNGLDLTSVLLLSGAGLVLWPMGGEFYREARLTQNVLSPGWFALILGIVVAVLAVLFLMHEATPYSNELWAEFGPGADTPRALRAALIASLVVAGFMLYVAMQPARGHGGAVDEAGYARASDIIAAQEDPKARLALTGDKRFFFSENASAFIMYAVQGKSWIAMGDPIGPEDEARDLAWAFFDAAYRANARPVFYEVTAKYLPIFVEMGLSLHKLGEEAVVDLGSFSLSGKKYKSMRAAHNQAHRSGLSFQMVPPERLDEVFDALKDVSDAWLDGKSTREKRFSVGRFDRDYLSCCPIAVVRREGRIIAFANILSGRGKNRVTIDLMRYLPEEGQGMMQFLFIELLEYYRAQGVAEFSLGMAPLAGLEAKHGTRLWNRFGAALFRHGGAFYNFAGLRAFKQKFGPEWRPRYLAVPGALPPFTALKDVAILIAGGAKGLISK
ncbi:MAG: bifunctional lysylphosphatidylglycerol flippase/synthetase MprF [Brevirhabdus sp.]